MSAAITGEIVEREDASIRELMEIACDLVSWVDGRVSSVDVGHNHVGVHVETQDDAERLARMLSLGTVTDFPPEAGSHAFTVWSSNSGPGVQFSVFCLAELVRPVRAFPPAEPWWLGFYDGGLGTEAA
ncbi:hypothetical protein [Xylanimonas protaetiae]|uniref:Uncharacterized protein n=1 Tax=Xylanimonas protaetiae TaxID=2509457 RepID=A0A4P6F4T9_9MICO|nr:hypothetical protein [Xylanimonas protaetiae]QAY69239.1 hypothetical protein ET471_03620 [Xylanimonas protaetiae]